MTIVQTPIVRQALRPKREPGNVRDVHACTQLLSVIKIIVVGHFLYNLVPAVSAFLRRNENKGFAEVTEQKSCALIPSLRTKTLRRGITGVQHEVLCMNCKLRGKRGARS